HMPPALSQVSSTRSRVYQGRLSYHSGTRATTHALASTDREQIQAQTICLSRASNGIQHGRGHVFLLMFCPSLCSKVLSATFSRASRSSHTKPGSRRWWESHVPPSNQIVKGGRVREPSSSFTVQKGSL